MTDISTLIIAILIWNMFRYSSLYHYKEDDEE